MPIDAEFPAANSAIDLVHLERYTLGEVNLNCEILTLFVQQSDACLLRLKDAADEGSWREAAHSLKGAAAGVGARRVADAAEAAFQCQGRQFTIARLGILDELASAISEAREFIEDYVPRANASSQSA